MKISTLVLVLITCASVVGNAQFDDKFYSPKKEWVPIPDSIDYKEISFEIGEEQNISGILLDPKAEFKQNILFFHGAGGNVSTYLFMTLPLTKMGYRVMMIDVRGYGKSDGIPTHLGIAEDAPKIFEWVQEQEYFSEGKIIIYGASMGTQVAANLALQKEADVSLLILDGPMLSFTDIAVESAPQAQKSMIRQFVTSPYSAKEDVQKLNIPILIVHSEGDKDIPFEMGEELFDLASEPKVLWKYEGGHLESAMKYPEVLDQKIQSLLQK